MSEIPDLVVVPAALKRGAIIGTAPSWRQAPWTDQTVDLFGLNDAYVLGFPRITGWFDLHPFSQMLFLEKGARLRADEVPVGAYVRPAQHREWLGTRTCPIYLADPHPEWPHAQVFPRDALVATFGRYFSSTPAWMLAWMIHQGYQEIQIWGIHLETQWEYVEQRPNLEFLLGIALARGIKIVIADRSPILKGRSLYAYEPKADLAIKAQQRRIDEVKARGARLQRKRASCPWYAPGRRADLQAALRVADLDLLDARQQLGRLERRYHEAGRGV